MSKILDRAGMTTATTGAGTVTLGSAITDSTNGNFQSFAAAGAANLDAINYLITDASAWELGTGTYTSSGTTLSRTLGSSSTGSLLVLSGTAKVYSAPFATDIKTPNLTEYSSTTPTAPTTGSTLFSRSRAGRRLAAQIGVDGGAWEFQPSLATRKMALFSAAGSSTTVTTLGRAAMSASGTATTRSPATGTRLSQASRIGYAPASAAINIGTGIVTAGGPSWFRGDAAGLGGFEFTCSFGFNSYVAGNRCFVGLGSSALGATIDPSALTDMVGVGFDAADANFSVMTNDFTGAATKTATGIAAASNKLFRVHIFCAPNASSIGVSLLRLDGTLLFETTITTDLASSSTFLFEQARANTGTVTTGAQIDICDLNVEMEY